QVGAAEQVPHHPRPHRAADRPGQRPSHLVERLEPLQPAYRLTQDVHETSQLRCRTGALAPFGRDGEAASSRVMTASALRVPPARPGTPSAPKGRPGNCGIVRPYRTASRHLAGQPHNHDIPGSTTPLISVVNAEGE